jgi:hypothetical protein
VSVPNATHHNIISPQATKLIRGIILPLLPQSAGISDVLYSQLQPLELTVDLFLFAWKRKKNNTFLYLRWSESMKSELN